MKNLIVRTLSGAVYVGLIIAALLLGKEYFGLLMAILTILGLSEIQRLLNNDSKTSLSARICDIIFAATTVLGTISLPEYGNLIIFLLAIFVLYLPMRIIIAVCDKTQSPARSAFYSVFSLMYICTPLILLYAAYCIDFKLVFATFVMIWMNDTGAYISGITMGRHKLCERLSPKKTWEGFFGGFIACIAVGIAYSFIYENGSDVIAWGVYAALISAMSTFGDLFESMIKRHVNVKDSGNLIPGHGGILDRIDSLLAVSPVTFIMALFLETIL